MNNPKNRILIFLVVFLLLTNIAMLLYFTVYYKTQRGPHGDAHHGPGVTAFLQNDAGFNEEQMKSLDSLKTLHRDATRPLFDSLGKSKDNFYQLLGKPFASDSMLKTAAAEIGRRQAALDLEFFRNFMSIRNLCTRKQLPEFDSAMPLLASKMMQPWQKNVLPKKR